MKNARITQLFAPTPWLFLFLWATIMIGFGVGKVSAQSRSPDRESVSDARTSRSQGEAVRGPLIITQVPADHGSRNENGLKDTEASRGRDRAGFSAWPYQHPCRLLWIGPDGSRRRLAESFYAAADPDVSFDGSRILFAGRRTREDAWSIWEMDLDGKGLREVVDFPGNCSSPRYLSTLYTLDSPEPWYTVLFVGSHGEKGGSDLFSARLDGSALTQLTYTLSAVADPYLMPDGRILFSVWQSNQPGGPTRDGYQALFAINIDGTDYATYAGRQGERFRRMPCLTTEGRILFIEHDEPTADGSGSLGSLRLRRPLHSYRSLTSAGEGRFHGPTPLPGGEILVSRRMENVENGTYGVVRFDPQTGRCSTLFDDPHWEDMLPRVVVPKPEPDGRSSVVRPADPYGELYCLDVYTSEDPAIACLEPGSVDRVRLVEGYVPPSDSRNRSPHSPRLPMVARRNLGEAAVEEDGSFAIKLPANMPVQLQLLDGKGEVITSCRWIWARNHEPRGCIGCHEDGELTPRNHFVDAVQEHSTLIETPVEKRRPVEIPMK